MLLLTAFSRLIVHPHWLFTSKPHPEEGNKLHEKNSRPVSTRQTKTVHALYCCEHEVAGIFLNQGRFLLEDRGWQNEVEEKKTTMTVYKSNRTSHKCKTLLPPLNSVCSQSLKGEIQVKSLKRGGGASVALWLADYSYSMTVLTNHVCKWSANRFE